MQTVPDCTIKVFQDTKLGELVRLRDGTAGIVGFVGDGVHNRVKAIACLQNPDLQIDAPWLEIPRGKSETLVSLGTDFVIHFDPLGKAIQNVGHMQFRPTGTLIIGKGTIAMELRQLGNKLPNATTQVLISEPIANQSIVETSNEQFAVLSWEIRFPAPYMDLPPLFTFKAS